MKIEQMNVPTPSAQSPQGAKGQSPRERAIAKLLGNAPSAQPVVANQNQIAPEEMGAIAAPKAPDEFELAKAEAQKHVNESEEVVAQEEPKAAEEPLSSQYAILARKEKAIRLRDQQLKVREAELKAKEDATKASPQAPAFDESKYISKDRLAQDPFSVLTDMGLTYDQLTELAMNGPKPKEIEMMNELKAMREELRALKGESESTKKTFEEYQQTTEKQGITELTKRANALVQSNPEFETIKETDSVGDVVELIKQTLKEDGVLLTVEEAAQQVEDYLLEEAMKLAKIKKIQQRLAPKAPAEAQKPTEQGKQQQMKTLTNAVGSSRQLSARERALLAFEGKLNK